MDNVSPLIQVDAVTKRFGQTVAVQDINFSIEQNEIFALLGPSGCGKTTLLRMLSGFEEPSEGKILFRGDDLSRLPPQKRPTNMVFQSYAVFPHMSVFDNVAYGLRVVGTPRARVDTQVRDILGLVKLEALADRQPHQLSGGQQQRVALARALVKQPALLLLDEPLSALDAKLREAMQIELKRLQREVGISFVVVTHDQNEAMGLATRIAVMSEGKLEQIGPPHEIYENPKTAFVADFIGQTNMIRANITARDDKQAIARNEEDTIGVQVTLSDEDLRAQGEKIFCAIRPEKIALSHFDAPDAPEIDSINSMHGTLVNLNYQGEVSYFLVEGPNNTTMRVVYANTTRHQSDGFSIGNKVVLRWNMQDIMVLQN